MSECKQLRKIEAARRSAQIDVIPGERHQPTEIAAFDVVVAGKGIVGRWTQIYGGRSMVVWTDGTSAATDGCEAQPQEIIEAARASIPLRLLGVEDRPTGRPRILQWLTAGSKD